MLTPLYPGLTPLATDRGCPTYRPRCLRRAPDPTPPEGPSLTGILVGGIAGFLIGGPLAAGAGMALGADLTRGTKRSGAQRPRMADTAAQAIALSDAMADDLDAGSTGRAINTYVVGPAAIAYGILGSIAWPVRVWNILAGSWLIRSALAEEKRAQAIRQEVDQLRDRLLAQRPHLTIPVDVDLPTGGPPGSSIPGTLPGF